MTTPPKPPYREEPFDVSAQNTTRIQNAIFAAIEGMHSDSGAASLLSDALSALACAEARYIAAIPDREHRRSVIKAVDAVREQMIDEYLRRGGGPKVQTIVARGGVN